MLLFILINSNKYLARRGRLGGGDGGDARRATEEGEGGGTGEREWGGGYGLKETTVGRGYCQPILDTLMKIGFDRYCVLVQLVGVWNGSYF